MHTLGKIFTTLETYKEEQNKPELFTSSSFPSNHCDALEVSLLDF